MSSEQLYTTMEVLSYFRLQDAFISLAYASFDSVCFFADVRSFCRRVLFSASCGFHERKSFPLLCKLINYKLTKPAHVRGMSEKWFRFMHEYRTPRQGRHSCS
jgi:hypothetical protein